MSNISFIIPTRNNLPYLKLAYNSIRKYYPWEEIIILDDNSTDGTKDWLWGLEGDISNSESGDKDLIIYSHEGNQVGHTVLYDIGVGISHNQIFTIFHADMVCGPNYVENLLKHLKPGGVVAATRVEPPLHPPGKEKIIKDYGIYSEDFKEEDFEIFCLMNQTESVNPLSGKTTKGIFAPWAMYKKDFLDIGGHDKFFSPFPYEDSDIFQRFILAGYDIKQSRNAFVYHFTCRGHRWTEEIKKDDLFYKLCCAKNFSHFIRKWGSWIQNDEWSFPIINHLYDIGFVIKNCPQNLLEILEPWCSTIYCDADIESYIKKVQPGTPFEMKNRVRSLSDDINNDIIVSLDGSQVTNEKIQFLMNLPKIITESGEVGKMEYDIFKFTINKLETYEKMLIYNNHYHICGYFKDNSEDPYCTDELFKVYENIKKHE